MNTSNASAPPAHGRFEAGQAFVLDLARIEVALEARGRYKYVRPTVLPVDVLDRAQGWRVVSPNCSRRIDPQGGEIDIAWLRPVAASTEGQAASTSGATGAMDASGASQRWDLYAHDHVCRIWVLKLHACSLSQALERLVDDPMHEFWK